MTRAIEISRRGQYLRLSDPELTALVGGLCVLGANCGDSQHGIFTKRPGQRHRMDADWAELLRRQGPQD